MTIKHLFTIEKVKSKNATCRPATKTIPVQYTNAKIINFETNSKRNISASFKYKQL